MKTKRSLKRDIEILRRMVAYYSELPDATLHLLRGLGDGKDALEHRWEVKHDWAKYPDTGDYSDCPECGSPATHPSGSCRDCHQAKLEAEI